MIVGVADCLLHSEHADHNVKMTEKIQKKLEGYKSAEVR